MMVGWLRYSSFNTQPPEGGWDETAAVERRLRCFNTQPPEGGWDLDMGSPARQYGFNTQPPEGGWVYGYKWRDYCDSFQHTAA